MPPQLQHVCFQTLKSWESTHHSCLSESCSKADHAEILALAKKNSGEEGVAWLGLEEANKSLVDWSSHVLTKGEMHGRYDVSGCCIWESIKDSFDAEIKKLRATNYYFPTLFERERDHMAVFTPEVTIPCLW